MIQDSQVHISKNNRVFSGLDGFVGRAREMQLLTQVLNEDRVGPQHIVRPGLIYGAKSVGKTELAMEVARKVNDSFPDGHIFIRCNNFLTCNAQVLQILQSVIHSLDPFARLTDDLTELGEIYQSLLGGLRLLIVVDDFDDISDIELMFPPAGCGLLITSENLVLPENVFSLELEDFTGADTQQFISENYSGIAGASVVTELRGLSPLSLRVGNSWGACCLF